MARRRDLQQQNEQLAQQVAQLAAAVENQELALESQQDVAIQFADEDRGWLALNVAGQTSMTRSELSAAITRSRIYADRHPLIKRGVKMRSEYVMGGGYHIVASDNVAEMVAEFLAYGRNSDVLFGHQAALERARQLDVDGSVLIMLATDTDSGTVHLRTVDVEQITEIVHDPEDSQIVRFFRRVYTRTTLDQATGRTVSVDVEQLHPAHNYRPDDRPDKFGAIAVRWDQPIYMVRTTGSVAAGGFGVPETLASLVWALAYKTFLEDFAALARVLSQFAYKVKTARGGVPAGKSKLSTTIGTSTAETNPPATPGSIWLEDPTAELQAVNKSGATLDIDSGKPLRLMVAAGLDLPDTILSADVDQGSLATARSMDRPTELSMQSKQKVWGQVFADVCLYAVAMRVEATGEARGQVTYSTDDTIQVEVDGEPVSIVVQWPPLVEHEMAALVSALQLLLKTPGADLRTVLRLMYQALNVQNIDELLDKPGAKQLDSTDDIEEALGEVTELLDRIADMLPAA